MPSEADSSTAPVAEQEIGDSIIASIRSQRHTLPLMRTVAWKPRPSAFPVSEQQLRLSWRALKSAHASGNADLLEAARAVFHRDLEAFVNQPEDS